MSGHLISSHLITSKNVVYVSRILQSKCFVNFDVPTFQVDPQTPTLLLL